MRTILLTIALVLAVGAVSGCRTGLLQGPEGGAGNSQNQLPVSVDGVRTSYADVVDKTSPAVVRIDAERRAESSSPFDDDFFRQFVPQGRQRRPDVERGMGSGVIVSADGVILTNHHVIADATKITVTMQDNRSFEAKVVGSDEPSDLAVLKVDGEGLPFLTLGNSDNVRVGDMVLAIGNPLGIGQTVTAGIISAKGRQTGISDGAFEDFLQTDAPINRGNSGGALVNLQGELIGINSQILSPSGGNIGIGFAIPSNMAKSVMDQLLEGGKVRRGMLGVNIQTLTDDVARGLGLENIKGVLVSGVRAGSAADKAGVKRGDVITSINGEKVDSGNVLRNKIAASAPGSRISLGIVRDGKEVTIEVTLDEFELASASAAPQEGGGESQSGKLGVTLRNLTPEVASAADLPADSKGLFVAAVDPDGAAAEAGVSRGDVILEINRRQVSSVDEVADAIKSSGDRPVLLLIASRGRTVFLTVKPR